MDLMQFDSGGAMLDVVRDDRLFVMAWFPTYQIFGVDEVKDDEGCLTHYHFTSPDFESAADELWKLVRGASTGSPALANLIDSTVIDPTSPSTHIP